MTAVYIFNIIIILMMLMMIELAYCQIFQHQKIWEKRRSKAYIERPDLLQNKNKNKNKSKIREMLECIDGVSRQIDMS